MEIAVNGAKILFYRLRKNGRKRALFLALVLICAMISTTRAFGQEVVPTLEKIQKKRPKIGLVLSGGGARGFAHVGVIKVLEENHIPVDYVTGASMDF
ncbi:MAG TPA: patatin-like phospholipase family protein [Pyrinomonadaceae bacterium]|nr:patatin-like phospholipase family protein [Pyrinomonadaceae bacterium]